MGPLATRENVNTKSKITLNDVVTVVAMAMISSSFSFVFSFFQAESKKGFLLPAVEVFANPDKYLVKVKTKPILHHGRGITCQSWQVSGNGQKNQIHVK